MKSIYKIFGVAILLSMATFAQAQIEKTKTFTGEFSDLTEFAVNHRRGALNVYQSKDGKTTYEATVFIKSKDEESAALTLERFELEEDKFDGKVEISTGLDIMNWSTINGKTRIKFKDGTKVSGIREIKVDMVVYVAQSMKSLHLKNKYDEIKIHDDLNCNLNIELYSGKLRTVDISGDLALKMKYSKGEIKNTGNLDLDIYDSDLIMGNLGKVQIESKYSSYKMGNLVELKGKTYDDNFELGNLTTIELEDKYSEFEMGNFQTGKFEFHDADLRAGNAETVEIKSKYSKFIFENVGAIEFENSFDDDLKAATVTTLSANSKYSEFAIKWIKESASIAPSFDDQLKISGLDADFKTIKIDGKYTKMDVDFSPGTPFHLNVDMTYGKVHFDEDSFETQVWKEKDSSKKEIVGKSKNATDASGKIVVLGFDNTIYIK